MIWLATRAASRPTASLRWPRREALQEGLYGASPGASMPSELASHKVVSKPNGGWWSPIRPSGEKGLGSGNDRCQVNKIWNTMTQVADR